MPWYIICGTYTGRHDVMGMLILWTANSLCGSRVLSLFGSVRSFMGSCRGQDYWLMQIALVMSRGSPTYVHSWVVVTCNLLWSRITVEPPTNNFKDPPKRGHDTNNLSSVQRTLLEAPKLMFICILYFLTSEERPTSQQRPKGLSRLFRGFTVYNNTVEPLLRTPPYYEQVSRNHASRFLPPYSGNLSNRATEVPL